MARLLQLLAVSTPQNNHNNSSESSTKTRKPRSTAPEGQSKAFDALQEFEQSIWETRLKPSMNEFNGQVADVWDVDQGSDRLFLNELRNTFKALVPREKYYIVQPSMTVSKRVSLLSVAHVRLTSFLLDAQYHRPQARQDCADWHAFFGKFSIKLVERILKERYCPNVARKNIREALRPHKKEICAFIANISQEGGEAYWAVPGSPEVRRSPYSCLLTMLTIAHIPRYVMARYALRTSSRYSQSATWTPATVRLEVMGHPSAP